MALPLSLVEQSKVTDLLVCTCLHAWPCCNWKRKLALTADI